MDTGCAHDLVSKSMAEGFEKTRLPCPQGFATANGRATAYLKVPMCSKAMGGQIAPYTLSDTPAVLSVGRRCVEEGYSFIWKASETPYLETLTGDRVLLFDWQGTSLTSTPGTTTCHAY